MEDKFGNKEVNELLRQLDDGLHLFYYVDDYEAYKHMSMSIMLCFLMLSDPTLTESQQKIVDKRYKQWINIEHGKQKFFSSDKRKTKPDNEVSYEELMAYAKRLHSLIGFDARRSEKFVEHVEATKSKLIDMKSELVAKAFETPRRTQADC